MCKTLKLKKFKSKVGEPVLVIGTKGQGTATWSGFAKRSRLDFWRRRGEVKNVAVRANSFIEGKVEFRVPGGLMRGVGLKRDVMVAGKLVGPRNTVKLVTRPPKSDFEKRIHDRWPVVKLKNGQDHVFTEADVILQDSPQGDLFGDK